MWSVRYGLDGHYLGIYIGVGWNVGNPASCWNNQESKYGKIFRLWLGQPIKLRVIYYGLYEPKLFWHLSFSNFYQAVD